MNMKYEEQSQANERLDLERGYRRFFWMARGNAYGAMVMVVLADIYHDFLSSIESSVLLEEFARFRCR
ncbi:hypothetical protein V6N12_007207 [Hibiscus sabdariffa]|uniref:Uncharacterized protein n=1 Tax=Hibiscus sabdariffa TaxID=183260 RepID=A0ABR2F142_9ROSI